ncbi:MAG: septation protein A [Rhodospirillales bacterium]|jgi:intracellular septation protein
MPAETAKKAPGWVKPAADYGPLIAFFTGYMMNGRDLMVATVWLMIATAIATLALLVIERRVPVMPLVTAGIVGVFGGLTLWLKDDTFIKMKPTIVQLIFAVILLGGLAFGKLLLKPLFGAAWKMRDSAWRTITIRYGLFFIAAAALNEVVWRTQSTDFWVNFKIFGLIGLTVLFSLSQTPLILREAKAAEAGEDS